MNPFDLFNEREARDFGGHFYGYVANWEAREEAAERRHTELVGFLANIVAAVAVGLHATADALNKAVR